ncbi:MAG: hypothetical protein RMA76_18675 [Deltaproteobacteria bacterium]|jgi:hypothetical protein
MSMNLDVARQRAREAVLQQLSESYPDGNVAAMEPFAEAVAAAVVAALQHIKDNAETTVSGERIG